MEEKTAQTARCRDDPAGDAPLFGKVKRDQFEHRAVPDTGAHGYHQTTQRKKRHGQSERE